MSAQSLMPTYRLTRPVTFTFDSASGATTETIETVTLREPTGGDMLLLDEFGERPMLLILEMIAALSGLTLAQVKQLPASDIGPLGDRAMAQLPGGQKTGANA